MCDPITLGTLASASASVGAKVAIAGAAGIGAIGKAKEGRAASEIAKFNTRVATNQAEDARALGRQEAREIRRQVNQIIGQQRVAFANQGVSLEQGTPLQVAKDTRRIGETDARRAQNNAYLRAIGFETDAAAAELSGALAEQKASFGVLDSLAQGAVSIATL